MIEIDNVEFSIQDISQNKGVLATIRKYNASMSACIKLGVIKEPKTQSYVYYIGFETNAEQELSYAIKNEMKFELIKGIINNISNHFLVQSNDKKPETLYKIIINPKGKEFSLMPRLTIE